MDMPQIQKNIFIEVSFYFEHGNFPRPSHIVIVCHFRSKQLSLKTNAGTVMKVVWKIVALFKIGLT